ncbi:rhodanese-like domain-containing protein [uncultured Desulfuromusa sp.]|nr:rhodanese-like domain-containing protein [uncultured Desulfuromusa sp.]
MTELQDLQAESKMVVIIDTRTPGQWKNAKDKIPGAIRINSQSDLQKLKADIPPDTEIVTYCT